MLGTYIAFYGQGFGRYSYDHDEVYRTLPGNVESLLSRVSMDNALMFSRDNRETKLNRNAAEAIFKERNNRWNNEKYEQVEITSKKLMQLVVDNKPKFPNEMFSTLCRELGSIMRQTEDMKGEIEI